MHQGCTGRPSGPPARQHTARPGGCSWTTTLILVEVLSMRHGSWALRQCHNATTHVTCSRRAISIEHLVSQLVGSGAWTGCSCLITSKGAPFSRTSPCRLRPRQTVMMWLQLAICNAFRSVTSMTGRTGTQPTINYGFTGAGRVFECFFASTL